MALEVHDFIRETIVGLATNWEEMVGWSQLATFKVFLLETTFGQQLQPKQWDDEMEDFEEEQCPEGEHDTECLLMQLYH